LRRVQPTQKKGTRELRASHDGAGRDAVFDDPHLLSSGALAPVVALSQRCGSAAASSHSRRTARPWQSALSSTDPHQRRRRYADRRHRDDDTPTEVGHAQVGTVRGSDHGVHRPRRDRLHRHGRQRRPRHRPRHVALARDAAGSSSSTTRPCSRSKPTRKPNAVRSSRLVPGGARPPSLGRRPRRPALPRPPRREHDPAR
jgi:hypothetical protein